MSVFKLNDDSKKSKTQKLDSQTVKNHLIKVCIKHTIYPEIWLRKQSIRSLRWLANQHTSQLKPEVQS